MLTLNSHSKISLFPTPVNLHKSFDSLMNLVTTELKLELNPNLFILFSNIRKNRIKILYHDGMHLMLFSTRFEHTLYFSYKKEIVFDSVTFGNFIRTPNPRSRKK